MTRGEVTRTARQRAGRKQDRHNGAGSESFSSLIEVGSYLSIGGGKKARVAKRQCSGPRDLSRRLEHFLQNLGNRCSVGPSRLLKRGGADFDRACPERSRRRLSTNGH